MIFSTDGADRHNGHTSLTHAIRRRCNPSCIPLPRDLLALGRYVSLQSATVFVGTRVALVPHNTAGFETCRTSMQANKLMSLSNTTHTHTIKDTDTQHPNTQTQTKRQTHKHTDTERDTETHRDTLWLGTN